MKKIFILFYLTGFKIHRKAEKMFAAVLWYSRMFVEAFWFVVFSDKTIAAIVDVYYARSKKYNQKAHNLSGLFDWEEAMINTYFKDCKSLMVLASGAGRELLALLKMGYDVEGYECNAKLLSYSKKVIEEAGCQAKLGLVAPSKTPENNTIYDGIILGWAAYTHIKGKGQRIAFLRSISKHLNTGAPFMLSYWYANSEILMYCDKLTKVNRKLCKIFRSKPIEKGDRLTPFFAHHFTLEEVAEELNAAGFKVIYQQAEPYPHSIAKKD